MNDAFTLRIGTRGSTLALIQTDQVCNVLKKRLPDLHYDVRVIKTSGDWKPEHGENRLAALQGGKGLFIKEIEQAIIDRVVDVGVHSLKDVPSFLPDGLTVDYVLPRADPRDVFITLSGDDFMSLPSGSVVGTASLRRQAIVRHLRPDLKVVPLRGNVQTRIDKLCDHQVDALILAQAGLSRLGSQLPRLMDLTIQLMDVSLMLPACGQGVIAIETREDNQRVCDLLNKIQDMHTSLCVRTERQILQILDGNCDTPIGAYATLEQGRMHVRAMVADPEGTGVYQAKREDTIKDWSDARALAIDLAHEIRLNAPHGVLPIRDQSYGG